MDAKNSHAIAEEVAILPLVPLVLVPTFIMLDKKAIKAMVS